jgi:ParB family chromosome partitioning protein
VQIPIDDIVIKKRVRKELGDLTPLVESLRRFGLMHPILVNKRNVLVSGRRRLEAAKTLGWKTINAVTVDARDTLTKLELEVEENVQRRELTSEEVARAYARIHKLRNPGFFRRIWNAIVRFFSRLFGLDE